MHSLVPPDYYVVSFSFFHCFDDLDDDLYLWYRDSLCGCRFPSYTEQKENSATNQNLMYANEHHQKNRQKGDIHNGVGRIRNFGGEKLMKFVLFNNTMKIKK